MISRGLSSLSILVLAGGTALPTFAQGNVPEKYVGIWGDDETCMAYHRGSLYWELHSDGGFELSGSDPPFAARYRVQEVTPTGAKLVSNDSGSSQTLVIRDEKDALRMVLRSGSDSLFFHKCDFYDVVRGIGRDPANVGGDIGTARHITFTFGYATAAASMCDRQIDGQTTERILGIGREAAQRYAITIHALPPESWARRLAEQQVLEGSRAAELDAGAIPDFCSWTEKAYGRNGWVVDGLYVQD